MPAARNTSREDRPEILNVGIDLGTSRSAVAASNGQRHWLESFVGWPRDFVAEKALGQRVLFGAEALHHRLAVKLVRPLTNGVIRRGAERDMTSMQELIGHLLALAGASEAHCIQAVVGVPAEALRVNREDIRVALAGHVERLMVVSEPFAVAYGLNVLNDAMVVDIGAGTVDFCILPGAMPGEADQRSLIGAGDEVDRYLHELLLERYPATDFSLDMVRRFKEKHGFVGAPNYQVEVEAPVRGRVLKHDITRELCRACESIMPPIVDTLMAMIARVEPEFQARVRQRILLAGGGGQIHGLVAHLTEATRDFAPCRFSCVSDPLFAGALGALGLAEDMPARYWEALPRLDN